MTAALTLRCLPCRALPFAVSFLLINALQSVVGWVSVARPWSGRSMSVWSAPLCLHVRTYRQALALSLSVFLCLCVCTIYLIIPTHAVHTHTYWHFHIIFSSSLLFTFAFAHISFLKVSLLRLIKPCGRLFYVNRRQTKKLKKYTQIITSCMQLVLPFSSSTLFSVWSNLSTNFCLHSIYLGIIKECKLLYLWKNVYLD